MAKAPPFHGIEQTGPDPLAAPPAMGSNSGRVDLALLLESTAIADMLADTFGDQLTRKDALLASYGRFATMIGNGISDDDTQGKAGTLAKQMRDHAKLVDTRRETLKRPVLDAGRQIDAYAKAQIMDPLEDAARKVVAHMTAYANAKARAEQVRLAEERRLREEAAREAAEKAEREAQETAMLAGAAAPSAPSDAAMDAAIAAEQAAIDAAERERRATPASTSRVRSDSGVTSSLRTTRKWELTSMLELVKAVAAGDAPINLLTTNDAILNVMARDRNQADIAGIRFYDDAKVNLR